MNACWAACIGNCSKKTSREHVVTKGLFLDDRIRVKGFSWCLDDFKVVGLSGIVKKALCTFHNSLLSELDDAAIVLARELRNAIELTNFRKTLEPQSWDVHHSTVDGSKLERWFLKTLITNAFGGGFRIGNGSPGPGVAPRDLVEIVFGFKQFQPPAGLYLIGDPGEKWSEDGVTVTTFGDVEGCHAGARFWFRGIEFMLLLEGAGPAKGFSFTTLDTRETTQITARYHHPLVHVGIQNQLSQTIHFNWDDA